MLREIPESYEYDLALSFAGENRDLVRHIANQLTALDVPVFYDEHFETNFLGQALTRIFKDIFSEKSRYVVCFLDKHYESKIWPTFEREIFLERVPNGQVIPVYLDDTKVAGIPHDIVGIKFQFDPSDANWRTEADNKIVDKLIDKVT